jgi:TctA family transporter
MALMIFSTFGFFIRRYGWPRAPLLLGLVLGEKMELYLWLSYTRYGFDWLARPAVMVLIVLLLGSIAYPIFSSWRQKTKSAEDLIKAGI